MTKSTPKVILEISHQEWISKKLNSQDINKLTHLEDVAKKSDVVCIKILTLYVSKLTLQNVAMHGNFSPFVNIDLSSCQ